MLYRVIKKALAHKQELKLDSIRKANNNKQIKLILQGLDQRGY